MEHRNLSLMILIASIEDIKLSLCRNSEKLLTRSMILVQIKHLFSKDVHCSMI